MADKEIQKLVPPLSIGIMISYRGHDVKGIVKILFSVSLITLGLIIAVVPSVSAISQQDADSIYGGTTFYDPDSGAATGQCSGSSLSGSDNETKTWNYFKAKGLSDQQVAGIMGNILQESHFNPLIMQKGGESQNPADADPLGWGIIQWTPGSKVIDEAQQAGLSAPIYLLSTELDLVWQHMHNNPVVTQTFDMNAFESITDEKVAATYFRDHIEGGSDPGGVRETNATNILNQYAGTGGGASGGSTGTCGEVSTSNGDCSVSKIVYDAEYSQAQLTQIFGDPGTAGSHTAMDANLISVDFLGHSVQVNKLIAPCLQAVASDWKANNITYKIDSIGCYRFDSDNGGSNIGLRSYHTYGAACDINPNTNNFYSNGAPRPYDPNCPAASGVVDSGSCYNMPPDVIKIFAAHGFYWGGNFNSVKDYMHFEWHGVVPQ